MPKPEIFTFSPPYGEPQQWLTLPFWNNFFLMVVLIWIQTGFAMVIFSAAIKAVPEDLLEAQCEKAHERVGGDGG